LAQPLTVSVREKEKEKEGGDVGQWLGREAKVKKCRRKPKIADPGAP
jgi:hypothetical protein